MLPIGRSSSRLSVLRGQHGPDLEQTGDNNDKRQA